MMIIENNNNRIKSFSVTVDNNIQHGVNIFTGMEYYFSYEQTISYEFVFENGEVIKNSYTRPMNNIIRQIK